MNGRCLKDNILKYLFTKKSIDSMNEPRLLIRLYWEKLLSLLAEPIGS